MKLKLGFFASGHLVESDPRVLVRHQPGPALADAQKRLAWPASHPPGNERPEEKHDHDGQNPRQHELGKEARTNPGKLDVSLFQVFNKLRIFHAHRPKEIGFGRWRLPIALASYRGRTAALVRGLGALVRRGGKGAFGDDAPGDLRLFDRALRYVASCQVGFELAIRNRLDRELGECILP